MSRFVRRLIRRIRPTAESEDIGSRALQGGRSADFFAPFSLGSCQGEVPTEKLLAGRFPAGLGAKALVAKNSRFYNALWTQTYLTRPDRFNTWPLIAGLLADAPQRLEVGPGLRPRLPLSGTHFLDLSQPVVGQLNLHGGHARIGEITALPHGDEQFDLVAAFDVIEHVTDDQRVFGELTRVLRPGGRLIFSVPLHEAYWTAFDDCVGHARRYEPAALEEMISRYGLVVEKSCPFGMQSNSPRLLQYAVDGLTRHPVAALRCYNWLFFPLGRLFESPLKFTEGLMDLDGVHEVLLVCRKGER